MPGLFARLMSRGADKQLKELRALTDSLKQVAEAASVGRLVASAFRETEHDSAVLPVLCRHPQQ